MTKTLKKISDEVKKQKERGKKVGLITGCFDILHFGHVQLFRFAKKHVDFLVVGLDNDKTISLSKEKNRPVNKLQHRLNIMSELKSVDLTFGIKNIVNYKKSNDAERVYFKIAKKINPDYLITSMYADSYWKIKKTRAKCLQIEFILYTKKIINSTTKIINKITKDDAKHSQ